MNIDIMAKNIDKKTTIALSEETKEQLAQFETRKGESYDEILRRVMKNTSNLCSKRIQDNDVVVSEEDNDENAS